MAVPSSSCITSHWLLLKFSHFLSYQTSQRSQLIQSSPSTNNTLQKGQDVVVSSLVFYLFLFDFEYFFNFLRFCGCLCVDVVCLLVDSVDVCALVGEVDVYVLVGDVDAIFLVVASLDTYFFFTTDGFDLVVSDSTVSL